MAHFSWWNWASKRNDFASPSNMTRGEVWTIAQTHSAVFLLAALAPWDLHIDKMMLCFCLITLIFASISYIKTAIVPHKTEKLYLAGSLTLFIGAWICICCAVLNTFDLHWKYYRLFVSGFCLINFIVMAISTVKLEKKARKEGKPSTTFSWMIHEAWFFAPLATLMWVR